jgi:hypothetical protein
MNTVTRFYAMKMNDSKSTQRPARNYDLRALLVLSVVVGAWLCTGIYLLVMNALQG